MQDKLTAARNAGKEYFLNAEQANTVPSNPVDRL